MAFIQRSYGLLKIITNLQYQRYLAHLDWFEKLVNMRLPCKTVTFTEGFRIVFPASPSVIKIDSTFLVTWGRSACCGPEQGWLWWSWWWAQTGQSSQSPWRRRQLLVSMKWQLYWQNHLDQLFKEIMMQYVSFLHNGLYSSHFNCFLPLSHYKEIDLYYLNCLKKLSRWCPHVKMLK